MLDKLFFGWLILINLIAAAITIHDKRAAVHHRRRTPEATLLTIGAIGGAATMYVTMTCIRHKTRKMKFMVSLPLFIVLHIAVLITLTLWQIGII